VTAKEEYQDFVASLGTDVKHELEAIPFSEFPLDHFHLHSILETLPQTLRERHAGIIRQVLKLNARMSLSNGKTEKPKPAPVELTPDLAREVSLSEIDEILSTSVIKDNEAKQITFLGMLLAQTNEDQLNIAFQSESAAGKTYVATEIADYFPEDEVVTIAGASATAFFHGKGEWNKETQTITVNLEGKILLFLDMPHYQLLEKLRPFLSHDQKFLVHKITDKSQKYGLKTKDIVIRGFSSVFFCSAKLNADEQERTRLILLSPAIDEEKLKDSIRLASLRKANPKEYDRIVRQDPKRAWLKLRIKAIRETDIREIIIPDHLAAVYDRFVKEHKHLVVRHQRDYPRLVSLIKGIALLNAFNRKREGDTIEATQADIDAGFLLYKAIAESNEAGLSPYVFEVFTSVIKPHLDENVGLKKKDIHRQYYERFHKMLSRTMLSDILSQLEAAGLIEQRQDPEDLRSKEIYPTH
jgi:hypothetical protein